MNDCDDFLVLRRALGNGMIVHSYYGYGLDPLDHSPISYQAPERRRLVGGFKHFLFSISYMGCHPSH